MELLNFIPDDFKTESATDSQKFCLNEAILFTLKMLFPIAPHISEYLWSNFNSDKSCIETSWPEFDDELVQSDEFELVIQVNGKVRGKMHANINMTEDEMKDLSLNIKNVKNIIGEDKIKKVIFVKNKLINFVT